MRKSLCLILGGIMLSLLVPKSEAQASLGLTDLRVQLKPTDIPPFDKGASVDSMYATIAPILGQLVYTTDSYDLVPGLLESLNFDYKRGAYILRLRDGLVFHNGRKVTSKDLEFSLLRGFYSKKPSFFISFLNNIEGIESIKNDKTFVSGKVKGLKLLDERTLEVRLIKPNPSFLHSIARPYFSPVPIEALQDDYETWKTYPVGAGSYIVTSFNSEKRLLKLKSIKNGRTISIHYGNAPFISDIEVATHTENKEIAASKRAASLTSIYFNYNNAVAAYLRFRQAIHLAVDRDDLSLGVEIYTPAHEFLAQHLPGRTMTRVNRNLDKAKALLKSIDGLDLSQTYEIPIFSGQIEDAKYGAYAKKLERQLSDVGLKVRLVNSTEKLFDKSNKTTLFRLASLGADVADPLVLFGLLRGDDSPLNPHFPRKDTQFEQLLDEAQLAATFDQKILSVKGLSEYVQKNVWMVPLFEKKLMISINPSRVQNVGRQDGGLTFFLDRVTLK